jgi:predicted AAA+ superfamily ATPase
MIKRNITPLLEEALADMPVLYLRGARQVGKSTLARQLLAQGRTSMLCHCLRSGNGSRSGAPSTG